MGNDDNTPLRGVTGGGLPAEIWRETAIRVHEGVPPRPLFLRYPSGEPVLVSGIGSGQGGSVVERVFRDVLRGLTGGDGGDRQRGRGPDPDFRPTTAEDR